MTLVSARPTWKLREAEQGAVETLARAHSLPQIVARLLVLRGMSDPEAVADHLEPSLMRLHAPRLLPGMNAACERLARAVREGEVILVHGDYDVDGVTGTALLVRVLGLLGAKVAWHIPNRFTDGYAFGTHSIERARDVGAKVIVSVDNGTSSLETITALAAAGVETIVTDHHEPPLGALPPAVAIINPKLPDSEYPFRELCGAAVAFKLAWGLCEEFSDGGRVRVDLHEFLVEAMAYVAIATVCDVVPLVDENRILGHFGLRSLGNAEHAGLTALLEVCGLDRRRLTAEDVGFQIGPRINAAGRLGSARTALELLISRDAAGARALAGKLDDLNRERKRIEREVTLQAMDEAERFADPTRYPVMVVAGQDWHQGVVGIVASRLVDRFHRPSLVIGLDGDAGRGSGRSVPGVDLLALMHSGSEHMPRYGGHAQAAGMDIAGASVDSLRDALCARAGELGLCQLERPPLWIDGELPLGEMTPRLMDEIGRLQPFGERNGKPVLLSRDTRLARPPRLLGADRTHLMMELRRGEAVLKALAFGMGGRIDELAMGTPVHAVYTPGWNTFRGQTNLELILADFRCGTDPGV
ncbi:MAG: single-stranded-DNA-specific exonuclease RecJ [Planctomycetes bacterium]|jgi:single-stranded-DNA-specific exonuclease|nr:single-stranded-DNA-specific exonuclease RecJ [Planctomycetota bacterium]MDP6409235.1 single-stranded-DNA-specific exonuclease RecJ [Planctomycetota bacterium]